QRQRRPEATRERRRKALRSGKAPGEREITETQAAPSEQRCCHANSPADGLCSPCQVLCPRGRLRSLARKHARVQFLQPAHAALPREELAYALSSGRAHSLTQMRVRQQSGNGRGQAFMIAAFHEDARL